MRAELDTNYWRRCDGDCDVEEQSERHKMLVSMGGLAAAFLPFSGPTSGRPIPFQSGRGETEPVGLVFALLEKADEFAWLVSPVESE